MKYFKDYEIACKCGCGQQVMNEELWEKINEARRLAGIPFRISSWNRCSKRNHKAGGTATSSHLTGEAIDIKYSDSHELFVILKALYGAEFRRVGINHTEKFIHVDVSSTKIQDVVFTY